jgi:processing peptidase subunit alpha
LDVKKQLDKSGGEFNLDESFRMDSVFPGVPSGKKIGDQPMPSTTSTTLENGLTVASQDMPGLMTSFAFIVKSGSSYESQTGTTQMLELSSFKSTQNRSHQHLLEEVEQLGGMVQCLTTRENILYCVDVLRENAEQAMDILADSVLRPSFTEDEVEESKITAKLMIDEMPSDMLSRDSAQMAAYVNYPLGAAHFASEDAIDKISAKTLTDFHSKYFVGENCFLAAAGIDHDLFVKLAKEKFGGNLLQAAPTNFKEDNKRAPSKYTGGMVTNQRDLKEPYVKIAIGFEVGGWDDDRIVAAIVLNQLLGGGSSFSAGGPGKGMYTRLYREVLNQYGFAESTEGFVSLNEDLGIIGIDSACPPEYISHMIRVMVDQFVRLLVEPVSAVELDRAKNMAKSMLLMQLESRIVVCEDIARQYVTYGHRKDAMATCTQIDAVTAEDLQALVDDFMSHPPSIGLVGNDLKTCPPYEDIAKFTSAYVLDGRRIRDARKEGESSATDGASVASG